MAKKKYYMVVNKKGNPILIDGRLPIYWMKWVAKDRCKEYSGHSVITVNVIPDATKPNS